MFKEEIFSLFLILQDKLHKEISQVLLSLSVVTPITFVFVNFN